MIGFYLVVLGAVLKLLATLGVQVGLLSLSYATPFSDAAVTVGFALMLHDTLKKLSNH